MPRYFLQCPFILVAVFCMVQCKKTYLPDVIKSGNNFLVVDGVINLTPHTPTRFTLTRTRNLGDSVITGIPESGASMTILTNTGDSYKLHPDTGSSTYASDTLDLDINQQYQLEIITTDGRRYLSDPVKGQSTPPIDNLTWQQPGDLSIYLNTHDPGSNTHYYKWDYTETWEHHASLQSPWGLRNGSVYVLDPGELRYRCWSTDHSSNTLIGSSIKLSQDLISQAILLKIPNGDPKLDVNYNINVRQYALSKAAYDFWTIIQKTSEGTGTLFDLQPSQINGNIHCTSNKDEPVIGFLTACTIQEYSIFINYTDLSGWLPYNTPYDCMELPAPNDQSEFDVLTGPDGTYAPYYFDPSGHLVLTQKICVDCTLTGGTYLKPSFWP